MEERRKNIKEKNELLNLKRNRNEQPTIRQAFSALKNDLKTLSQSDWESIPEIKDFTIKKRKIERYIPITDSEIIAALNDTIIPLKEEKEVTLENVGKAKNSILKMLIDKIGEEKEDRNSIDRLSYLTELNTLNKDNVVNPLNSFEGIQDMKKAKLLLNNLIMTNPDNPLSYISAARLEVMDNEQIKAKEILSKAIEKIKNSEDLWVEYARLYDNDPNKAKDILRQGITYLPKSEKLYIELVKIEKNINEKKKILKKCLFEELPTSEILWKLLIELEKNNPDIYKRLLLKCTEYFPKTINNWILLSRQCDYKEGKEHLLKAIKLNEDSLHIRMFYMFFEEKENKKNENKEKILKEIFDKIIEEMKDKKLTNEELISFACESEKSNCLISNKIIINYTLTNFKKNTTYKETKNVFKKIIEDIKSQEYKYIYKIKQIYITLLQLNDNKDIELWVQYIDYIKTNISVGEIENIFKEAINKAIKDVYKETFYLLYAKILKENNEIDKAILLLKEGYNKINRENILFALVKLYDMKKLYRESISLLKEGMKNKKYENNHDIIINLIKEYINIEDIEQALIDCHIGIKKFPKVDEFYLLNTDLLLLKAQKDKNKENKEYLEEASNILRTGIKLIPQSYKLYIKLSNILLQIGQENQARAIIDKGLGNKNNVDCAILYREQILLEIKIGNKNLAKNLLAKSLKKFGGTKDEDLFKELEKQINYN